MKGKKEKWVQKGKREVAGKGRKRTDLFVFFSFSPRIGATNKGERVQQLRQSCGGGSSVFVPQFFAFAFFHRGRLAKRAIESGGAKGADSPHGLL
mmetsp:Transcript_30437/g.59809  ORF Transcript_30437/g.59809 Transcript_30437/m.59809 type:complete len:95 (+) Transcript_30437:1157-1441(+)